MECFLQQASRRCSRSNWILYRSYLDLWGRLQFWHKDFLSLYIFGRQYCVGLICGMYGTSAVSSELASTSMWMRQVLFISEAKIHRLLISNIYNNTPMAVECFKRLCYLLPLWLFFLIDMRVCGLNMSWIFMERWEILYRTSWCQMWTPKLFHQSRKCIIWKTTRFVLSCELFVEMVNSFLYRFVFMKLICGNVESML